MKNLKNQPEVEQGSQPAVAKKVAASTLEKLAFFTPFIEEGKFTEKELFEMSKGKFPKVTESTIRTFLIDSKNPKYNKFPRLVVKTEDGKVKFQGE